MRRPARVHLIPMLVFVAAGSALLAGCAAHTAAYQREHLVDPIMTFQAQAKLDARRMKTFESREGSTGGIGGAGGGCACK